MHTMPAARPSRPSTKFTALIEMTTSATVSRLPCQAVSATVPTPGTGIHRMVRPWITITLGGDHLRAELDQGVDLELVVQDPDQPDQRGAREQRAGLVGALEDPAQVLEVVRDEQTGAEPEEHGDPAEPRCRLPVHVAGADLRHGAGRDRELPHRAGQQVGNRGRHTERQQVITHRLPHRNRWPSEAHTLARAGSADGYRVPPGGGHMVLADGCTASCRHQFHSGKRAARRKAFGRFPYPGGAGAGS